MAPPAKRRAAAAAAKRRIVSDSESDYNNDVPVPTAAATKGKAKATANAPPPKNTLKNFFSPEKQEGGDGVDSPAASPSSLRRKSTVSSTQSQPTSQSQASGTLKPPLKLSRQNTATKSPSTSPEKTRGKPLAKKAKIEEKGKSADIMSLFSRQAQRNLVNGLNGTKKERTPVVEDIISDPISEDDVAVGKASSSIVGANAQKRFKEAGSQQTVGIGGIAASQRFVRPTTAATQKKEVLKGDNDQLRPWSERFAPANLDELAVHKRKVADVRRWLEDVLGGRLRQRLLVLKGAAGTGKTTTTQLLARELGCEVLEWRNSPGSLGANQGHMSASAQFEEFLGRGGKFGQLELDEDSDQSTPPPSKTDGGRAGKRQIILIEEFPNTFMRSSSALTSFRSNILQFLAANTPALATFGQQQATGDVTPIVMIISETLLTTTSASADSFTAHRLLGPEISRHPGTAVIEFNAVAPTLLTKALELVVQKEARKSGRKRTPGPLVLKRLGEVGDIRSAISALEFLMVKGDDDAEWGARVMLTKPKKAAPKDVALTKGEQESLELITQRESSLGIFHAVGKVVYNKRDERPYPPGSVEAETESSIPPHMAHLARKKRSEVDVERLIDETGTDTATFISALHENYVGSCEPSNPHDPNSAVDYVNECIEWLSESDLMCPSFDIFFGGRGFNNFGKDSGSHILRQDEMAFQVAVRGLLFSLPSPVKRKAGHGGKAGDAFKMFYPTSLKLWRAKEELEGLVDMWAGRILKGEDAGPGPANGSTTNGAVRFAKGKQLSVNDWASPKKNKTMPPPSQPVKQESQDSSAAPPLLSLGSSARREMLLERLPYMAQIARRRRCSFGSMALRDLDKMVTFQGIGGPATEDDKADPDEDAAVAGETWATDKPTEEETPRKKGLARLIRAKEKEETTVAQLPVQSLVISDDDIEDD